MTIVSRDPYVASLYNQITTSLRCSSLHSRRAPAPSLHGIESNIESEPQCQHEVQQHLSNGESAIVVAVDGRVVGVLFAADTVRPAASAAVSSLTRRGINVLVASGDRREAVWAAAAAAGVPKESTSWGTTPGEAQS